MYNWKNHTILICEDDEGSMLLLISILQRTNAVLLQASTGFDAIIQYNDKSQKIDLILTDIKMPSMDGFEVVIKIRAANDTVPIFAQTARYFSSDYEHFISAGFNEVFSKPLNMEVLLATINTYFSTSLAGELNMAENILTDLKC